MTDRAGGSSGVPRIIAFRDIGALSGLRSKRRLLAIFSLCRAGGACLLCRMAALLCHRSDPNSTYPDPFGSRTWSQPCPARQSLDTTTKAHPSACLNAEKTMLQARTHDNRARSQDDFWRQRAHRKFAPKRRGSLESSAGLASALPFLPAILPSTRQELTPQRPHSTAQPGPTSW